MNEWNSIRSHQSLRLLSCIAIIGLASTAVFAGVGPRQLISTRNVQVSLPAGGNGDSVAPQTTPDGRFVLFSSSATDLVTNGNGLFALNVFLRDRSSNTTVLVSANRNGTGGGNGNSLYGMVSTNGRYVVFQSDANDLVPGDTNGSSDIFLRDLVSGTTTLISVGTDGVGRGSSFGLGGSSESAMTPDGRYVAFISSATNLVANDTNGIPDVFVRDTVSNTTTLVSVGATGANLGMEAPVLTPDGRYVAFASSAKGLAPGVSASSQIEIYLRDLAAGTTKWVSSNASLILWNVPYFRYAPSYHPVMSDDGKFIAFKTGLTTSTSFVFQVDSTTASTTIVSTNGFPRLTAGDDVYGPEMTPDGRFIAYVATNRAQSCLSVNLWDAQTGTNLLVSAAMDGNFPTNTASYAPAVSADGRFVVFLSTAGNLVSNAVVSGVHVYLRDVQAGSTQLIDADTNSAGTTDELGTVPVLSADGRFAAFASRDGSLVDLDQNNAADVFVRDTLSAATELISARSPALAPQTGNASSSLRQFSLSADGRWIAYASYASDLVTNDFNRDCDVFVGDLQSGSNILVSVGMDGNTASGGSSVTPVLGANGRFVAFVSMATNLVANDTNGAMDIFVRDLQSGTTTLASVDSSGVSLGTGDSSAPVISSDGRYVAFLAKTNTSTTYPGTFWRDLVASTTIRLAGASSNAPSMSADGQRVAYFDSASRLYVWDAQLAGNIYTNPATIGFASLAPAGNRLLYQDQTAKQLGVLDLSGNAVLFSCTNTALPKSSSTWSSDGRFVTFATSAAISPGDANGTNDVFLCDLQTGTLTLLSANSGGTASANGASDWPAISGDARFVVYRSFATDIVPGTTNVPSLYVFDRMLGTTALLATGSAGSWSFWISQPSANSNGTTVAFQSWDSGLVAGDLNRAQDIFAQSQDVLVPDTDGDGIPDWWMIKYFGHATGQENDSSRAQDDADGDGTNNLQEYLAGTDPKDPASVFRLQISPNTSPAQGPIVSWPAAPGRSYQLQFKTNLMDSVWMNVPGNLFVLGSFGYFTAPALDLQESAYYRILVGNN